MNKVTEQMMKDRTPVHPKCQGIGFTDDQAVFLKAPRCERIEPIEVFEIIDEETGTVDPESKPEKTVEDPACRCTVYMNPSYWWNNGRRCPMANHFRPDLVTEKTKTRAGQQKQKKKK